MRILICLNRDLMGNLALNLLWPALEGHRFDIVLSHGVGSPSTPRAEAIAQWGRVEHALIEGGLYPLLEARGPDPFQTFEQRAHASESGRPHVFASLNRGEGLAYLEGFAPDVIVSIRYGGIFKAPAIAVPRLGILNLHSGLLPAYRGVLATFWAMLENAPEIGCTLHRVTDGTIDTGAIVATHARAPQSGRSVLWNVASLYPGGAGLIASALAKLSRCEALDTAPQDPAGGRYFSYPGEAEMAAFTQRGLTLFSRIDYAAILERYGVVGGDAERVLTKMA